MLISAKWNFGMDRPWKPERDEGQRDVMESGVPR